jgi:hypothetical protein
LIFFIQMLFHDNIFFIFLSVRIEFELASQFDGSVNTFEKALKLLPSTYQSQNEA